MQHPVQKPEAPKIKTGQVLDLNKLRQNWDLGLLALLVTLMLGSGAFLLWPQPQAKLSLLSFKEANGPAVSTTPEADWERVAVEDVPASVELGVAAKSPAHKSARRKPKRQFASHKKSANPPVLDLNRATMTQFQLLPGIGPKTAVLIIEYRKTHGPFASPEQIMDVKGIGPKKFAKMKAFLKV